MNSRPRDYEQGGACFTPCARPHPAWACRRVGQAVASERGEIWQHGEAPATKPSTRHPSLFHCIRGQPLGYRQDPRPLQPLHHGHPVLINYNRLNLEPVCESVNTAVNSILGAAGVQEKAEVVEMKERKKS